MTYFTRLVARPAEIPVADPELKLVLFRCDARVGLGRLLSGQEWIQKEEKSGEFSHFVTKDEQKERR